MRLSAIMAFGKKPHGFKYRGKHRVVKGVQLFHLANLKTDYERTEKNMLYLRHPYLTVEQSHGHMDKQARNSSFWAKVFKMRDDKFSKHVTLADRLCHLKVKEAWD